MIQDSRVEKLNGSRELPALRIKFCRPCGYRTHAYRLASLARDRLGVSAELVGGSFGVFKVWVGERLVFDKRQTRGILGKIGFGRLPPDDELLALIASAVGPRST